EPTYLELSRVIKDRLPNNAALIVDRRYLGENTVMEFFVERTCYPLETGAVDAIEKLKVAGAVPFVLSTTGQRLVPYLPDRPDGWTIYECKAAP
ncbi:MAG: hypothetical protein AABZ08_12970, partial [Planctomycetota bacterium]